MDLTFRIPEGTFNLRAAAVILHEGRILAMQDERSPYYYIPGGRVAFGETAETAILREVQEELGIDARIIRPLWLNQGFFSEDVSHVDYHEVALYFLMDVTGTDLLSRGDSFIRREGQHTHLFQWLPIAQLQDLYFYPLFLKERILDLPEHLTLLSTAENDVPARGSDLSFDTEMGRFTLRVCGVFLQDGRLLAADNGVRPGWHIPGGRVKLHEDFVSALRREMQEELGTDCTPLRPLWFDQRIYSDPVSGQRLHELCLYCLMDASAVQTQTSEAVFRTDAHTFRRVPASAAYICPPWLRQKLAHLPDHLELVTHNE